MATIQLTTLQLDPKDRMHLPTCGQQLELFHILLDCYDRMGQAAPIKIKLERSVKVLY